MNIPLQTATETCDILSGFEVHVIFYRDSNASCDYRKTIRIIPMYTRVSLDGILSARNERSSVPALQISQSLLMDNYNIFT